MSIAPARNLVLHVDGVAVVAVAVSATFAVAADLVVVVVLFTAFFAVDPVAVILCVAVDDAAAFDIVVKLALLDIVVTAVAVGFTSKRIANTMISIA